jgi:hypothetical protein
MVAHRQLRELGIGQDAIEYRVHVGRLHKVFAGVYTVGSRDVPELGVLHGAVLSCGPGALLSHRGASELWNVLPSAQALVDVTTLRGRCADRERIRVHRVRQIHPDDRAELHGIPVTSLARTLLDIAEVVPRRRLVYALEKAERLGVFDLRGIEAVMARGRGRRGLKALKAALDEVEPEALYAHKGLERPFIAFCRCYGLPMPAMNVSVEGYTVDAFWAEGRLVVELDSWEHHKDRRAFEDDRRRDAALKLARYEVLRVTHRWLTREPEDLARTIRALIASPLLAATA